MDAHTHLQRSHDSWVLSVSVGGQICQQWCHPLFLNLSSTKYSCPSTSLTIYCINTSYFISILKPTTHVSRTLEHSNCCGFIRGCLFFCGTSCGVFILSHQKYYIKHTTEGSVDNFLHCWRLKIDWNGFLSWIFWRGACNRCVPFYLLTLETSRPQRAFMFAPVGAGVTGHVCLKAGVTASFIQGPRFAPLNIMWQW